MDLAPVQNMPGPSNLENIMDDSKVMDKNGLFCFVFWIFCGGNEIYFENMRI